MSKQWYFEQTDSYFPDEQWAHHMAAPQYIVKLLQDHYKTKKNYDKAIEVLKEYKDKIGYYKLAEDTLKELGELE